jgi:hypothetical protein
MTTCTAAAAAAAAAAATAATEMVGIHPGGNYH